MIEMLEGRRLHTKATATPFFGEQRDEMRAKDAERGSANLRDAILRAKGHPTPPRRLMRVPTVAEAKPVCCDKCGSPLRPAPRLVAHIQAAVAAYYQIDVSAMTSSRRTNAHPRQVAMYLASELTPKSLPDIGRRFGGRDHTTVMHACRAVKSRIAEDPEVALDVAFLKARLAA
jgi:hypothetical protein